MILQPSYIAIYHFLQNVFTIFFFFFYIFRKNENKNRKKCIILMYCLYESINKHNADVTFFVHALAMF